MKIYGKAIDTIAKDRLVKLLCSDKIIYLYFQRKDFREFGPYLFDKPYLFVEISNTKKKVSNIMAYEVLSFLRIVQPSKYSFTKKRIVYFDMETIRKGVRKLINKPHNKMFIDLEFTMPSYYQTMHHIQEIVQYGFIVEDKNGNIVFKDSSLVKPSKIYNLNSRTLKFISRKREEFDDAITYMDFYRTLELCMKTYKPKVYAWGRNDIITIDQSFIINHVKPLNVRENHIDLMKIIKNYYNMKDELGLFQTYQEMSKKVIGHQIHNALEDAMIAREIFNLFKKDINNN